VRSATLHSLASRPGFRRNATREPRAVQALAPDAHRPSGNSLVG
jgi:hypothetical protein